eukprot:GFUD01104834.1.p2 GENE.GFUD01104834.1~~GFUD01104834.1.p2  ORF type:complete len:144 (-),score=41.57 GFUD01104834.1:5-436(-)
MRSSRAKATTLNMTKEDPVMARKSGTSFITTACAMYARMISMARNTATVVGGISCRDLVMEKYPTIPIPPSPARITHCTRLIELMLKIILLSSSKMLKIKANTTPPNPLKKTMTADDTFSHLAMMTFAVAPVIAVLRARRTPR